MKTKFDKLDKFKAWAFLGTILLLISPFSFFERQKTLEILESNRIAKGVVLNRPQCPNGYRQEAECVIKVIDTDSIISMLLPSLVCKTLEQGDSIVLKCSKDFKNYYVDNNKYYKTEKQEYILSIVGFFVGLILISFYFLNINKRRHRV